MKERSLQVIVEIESLQNGPLFTFITMSINHISKTSVYIVK
jgi:hypothetical protein